MNLKNLSIAIVCFSILGCGGGGGTTSTTDTGGEDVTVKVVDGYIKNSSVLIDINTKTVSQYDDGDVVLKTDDDGTMVIDKSIKIPNNTIMYATGGVNTATGKEFVGTLTKVYESENELYITPLTTMVATKFKSGDTLENSKSKIAKAINISENDINSNPLENKTIFKVTQQVVAVASLIDSDIGNALSTFKQDR